MSAQPLVTVIIPIYNVGKFISKCVESVLHQTHDNLELILVDDGSPDDAGAVCDKYAETDKRIKVVHKENGGVSSARNAGLDIATGDYIIFIDGDDWVDIDHVEYLLHLCRSNDVSMSMSYGIHTADQNTGTDIEDRQQIVNGVDVAADLLYHKTIIGSYNKLFKRGLIRDNNVRFNEDLFIGEGFNFIVMCSQLSDKVATGNRKTYHYRLDNEESAMTKFNIDKIRNNDKALDAIQRDFMAQSRELDLAWNYARWLTSLSFAVWTRLAGAEGRYSEDYRKMLREVRTHALRVTVSNVGVGKKVSAVLSFISPSLMIRMLELKRRRNVR